MLRTEAADDRVGLAGVHGGGFVFASDGCGEGLPRQVRGGRERGRVGRKCREVLEIDAADESSARLIGRRVLQCRGKAGGGCKRLRTGNVGLGGMQNKVLKLDSKDNVLIALT